MTAVLDPYGESVIAVYKIVSVNKSVTRAGNIGSVCNKGMCVVAKCLSGEFMKSAKDSGDRCKQGIKYSREFWGFIVRAQFPHMPY